MLGSGTCTLYKEYVGHDQLEENVENLCGHPELISSTEYDAYDRASVLSPDGTTPVLLVQTVLGEVLLAFGNGFFFGILEKVFG